MAERSTATSGFAPLTDLDGRTPAPVPAPGPVDGPAARAADAEVYEGPAPRWMGWRLRALVASVVLTCLALVALVVARAAEPTLAGVWRIDAGGRVTLAQAVDPALRPYQGDVLLALSAPDGSGRLEVNATLLHRSPRWIVGDAEAQRHRDSQHALDVLMHAGNVSLEFARSGRVELQALPPGPAGLGLLFWMLVVMGGVLIVMAAVVMLARPTVRNLPYLVMCGAQAGVLWLMGAESAPTLGIGPELAAWDAALRPGLDIATAAALAIATGQFPTHLPRAGLVTGVLSTAAAAGIALVALPDLQARWWWIQGLCAAFAAATLVQLYRSQAQQRHPLTRSILRFTWFAAAAWLAITAAVAATAASPAAGQTSATIAAVAWSVFSAAMILLTPFLSRSQHVMREFALVAGISTLVTVLDLLFVSAFSIGEFTSLTLALFLALALYGPARQWLMSHLMRDGGPSMEQVFEQLYRAAREVQRKPERLDAAVADLFRQQFEPLQLHIVRRPGTVAWVVADGSSLYVPIPVLSEPPRPSDKALLLRFAQRGRRLFTADDARLADRLMEQLRHMVAYDMAVERGRAEERTRIAQDLHDDIGARLLTLIYQSPTPELEEYARHTLQDLKTLTRGLAAGEHRLSHASAEWKRDLAQRLELAHCELQWRLSLDRDLNLSVVHWSALTRVLRELVNNTITHARATLVQVDLRLDQGQLELSVRDNGCGRNPAEWSHGLGLGGVRKRVKQLGGVVQWREAEGGGIACEARIPLGAEERTGA